MLLNICPNKIKSYVDSLASVGHILTDKDHIDDILDDLTDEYDAFITSILTRSQSDTVEEVEFFIMTQEARIEKNAKSLDSAPSANFALSSTNNGFGDRARSNFSTNFGQGRGQGISQGNGGHFNAGNFGRDINFNRGKGNGGRSSWNNNWNNTGKPQC